jgi:ribonuclease P protein component
MRLPSTRCLRRHGDFQRVKSQGRSQAGRSVVLNVLQTGTADPWRCAFITSAKIGGAVQRNRVRRRLREIVRSVGAEIPPGVWFVTIARWRAPDSSFEELRRDWIKTAVRVGLLKDALPKTS